MTFPTRCPGCGGMWEERAELIGVRRRDWDSLGFRCHGCGIGYSNATSPAARIRIVREPANAVPAPVAAGLDDALVQALNVRNRPSKRDAFCSANAEDAVTWTVFRALERAERLDGVPAVAGLDHGDERGASLLLWGVPISGADARATHEALVAVSDELGEHPLSRSEPDVILVFAGLIVFLEAKTGSGNDSQSGATGFGKYLGDACWFRGDPDLVAATGLYELTRNWVIGNKVADRLGRDFALLNLGPPTLQDDCERFADLLATTAHRRFGHLTWSALLDAAAPLPAWLETYVSETGVGLM